MNIVVLQGTLSSEPTERTLKSGLNVLSWDVATETDEGRLTVPVQWDDPSKRVCQFVEGDAVMVFGVVRRRFFRTGGKTEARTEVVGSQVAKLSQSASVSRMFDRVRQKLPA